MKYIKQELVKLINASTPNFKIGDNAALMDEHNQLAAFRVIFSSSTIVILAAKNQNLANLIKTAKIIAPLFKG